MMSKKEKHGAWLKLVVGVAIPAIVVAIVTSGRVGVSQPASEAAPSAGPPITISYVVPNDLPGAPNLTQASAFAWQEFIALNWPAVKQAGQPNQRDQADPKQLFGAPSYTGPLVWQTFRAKVEIFTSAVSGGSNPPGYSPTAPSFGYDALPQYTYATAIPPYAPPAPGSTPWINLDEDDEIGVNRMYAGVSAGAGFPAPQILFGAKANRAEYTYIAGNQWFLASNLATPKGNTATYVATHKASPPPGSPTLVSLPNGTIEVKMAFRPLATKEAASGRFYSTTVRYYRGTPPTYVDTTMGLVALHIIQKMPSRPYFVFATFGQADNLLTAGGQPVEDVNGQPRQSPVVPPFDKNITSQNATATAPQSLSPAFAGSTPRARLYVENESASLPQGNISLNKRKHPIPRAVIAVNAAAHSAIQAYNAKNAIPSSPWLYYKLVNVQYEPYDKPAGIMYMGAPGGPDPATYYQANAVVESDYNLQVFSGRFNPFPLITDYTTPASPAVPFKNVLWSGKAANMGGCMGCHGNAEVGGTDFSFLIGESGYNTAPEVAGSTAPSANTRLFTGHP
jgi:hypothetical protein